ncbi:FG-GAP repeat domain-containing protein [Chachezhania sediminis]|uniref:FG-GAP repeat domain-containing protein n=1 Tax=Chachezhania sediminis TaxID=2599291 RepID=UPI00131AE678|nr:VCBS repeat-containing protein [Chachezhania sediminis]
MIAAAGGFSRAAFGAAIWAAVLLALCFPAGAAAEIVAACYVQPTTRYDHGVLGDAVEWGALELEIRDGDARALVTYVLPDTRVFEDIAPRLADVDGDGTPEVIVVETDVARGAQLAIYDETGKIAATDPIGRPHRWLAPAGAADLDGDGLVEIAYVDRPHLAKELKILRFRDGGLTPVAAAPGVTNHRIGDDFISGGVRTCGARPDLVLLDGNWDRVVVVAMEERRVTAHAVGPASRLPAVLDCR